MPGFVAAAHQNGSKFLLHGLISPLGINLFFRFLPRIGAFDQRDGINRVNLRGVRFRDLAVVINGNFISGIKMRDAVGVFDIERNGNQVAGFAGFFIFVYFDEDRLLVNFLNHAFYAGLGG